jgi:hypothetical protein
MTTNSAPQLALVPPAAPLDSWEFLKELLGEVRYSPYPSMNLALTDSEFGNDFGQL